MSRVKIGSEDFKIPRIVFNNIYKEIYKQELWLDKLLTALNRTVPIYSFIDIGVNVGQTLLKIKSINPDVKYVGFEPNPFCCSFTQQIISINSLNNCKIIPCGLSDKNQILELFMSGKDNILDSSASVVKGFRKRESINTQFVTVLKLDEIIEDLHIEGIDVLKIDIEGAELEAVRGMLYTLKHYKPIVIMEVLPSYNSENEFRLSRQNKLAELLSELKYNIFQIRNKVGATHFEKVIGFPVHANINESDYLLLPEHININDLEFKRE